SNGGDGHTSHKAGGSGGSVWLEINALSGSGSIEANGGTGNYFGGGGGGGRVAIYYDTLVGTDLTAVRAQGGMGDSNGQSGGVGTVYYQDRITNAAELQFIGSSSDTAITEFTQGNIPDGVNLTLNIENAALAIQGDWQLTDLQLTNSTVNHVSGQMLTSNGILTLDNSQLTVGVVEQALAAAQWSSVTLSNSSTLSHRA
ncbi:MAG: hypothetical protein GY820_47810, partial [Gammaproteobacteria bacterium]|nr:hypothetical protein [Gammaproteobacteria bacterium]